MCVCVFYYCCIHVIMPSDSFLLLELICQLKDDFVVLVVATIKSTVDACDVADHELAKLVASLLEVR